MSKDFPTTKSQPSDEASQDMLGKGADPAASSTPVAPPKKPTGPPRSSGITRATPRVMPKIEYRDADTPSPSPSSASYGGSVYHDAAKSSTDIDDIKPAISDDAGEADSSPSPSKRRKTASGASGKGTGARGARASKKVTPKKEGAAGGGRVGSWTAEEDWKLFQHVYPRITPNWAEVSRDIGRDVKSCSNRLALLNKRLPNAIRSISGQ